jgi:imidazolonepropionase-like amidohydrolase
MLKLPARLAAGACCALLLETAIPVAAQQPTADVLRAITTNGYRITDIDKTRGPIKPGYFADLIALPGNPLDDVDALKNVQFVMKDGLVFKRDGVVTPAAFFHGGPVNGWRIR